MLVRPRRDILEGDGASDILAGKDGLLLPPHENADVARNDATVGRHCLAGSRWPRVAAHKANAWSEIFEE